MNQTFISTTAPAPAPAKNRIQWIDCAKGIAILLVIIGHSIDAFPRAMIFSFHMPLFFILSGLTSRPCKDTSMWLAKARSSFVHLMIPAIAMYLLRTAVTLYENPSLIGSLHYWKNVLLTLLFASGVDIEHSRLFGGAAVPAMGIPWFFFTLFSGKIIYSYLRLTFSGRRLSCICLALSLTGVILGSFQWLPFSLDITLAVLPFFHMGDCLKQVPLTGHPWKLLILSCILWLSTLLLEYPDFSQWTYLELAWRRYPHYPLCFITAAAGSLFLFALSILTLRLRFIARLLIVLGRHSMCMLCIHIMDYLWAPLCSAGVSAPAALLRKLAADISIFLLLMLLRRPDPNTSPGK